MQGILLAAGFGQRFQAEGGSQQDKLLACLPNQHTILYQSASTLINVLPNSIAVVQPQQTERQQILQDLGFNIVESHAAKDGMGYAIADAVKATEHAEGWLIALADMPWVSAVLLRQLADEVKQPQTIAAPRFNGKRGQPVAFGRVWFDKLAVLHGDVGARELLKTAPINWVEWHDATIDRDVDLPVDLDSTQ